MAKPVYELIIGNLHEAQDASDPDVNWGPLASVETHECQAVETRGQKAKKEKLTVPLKVTSPISEVSLREFLNSQKDDASLTHFWQKTMQPQDRKYHFTVNNGYLVRIKEPSTGHGKKISQVVIPVKYRASVLP